jgi:hypothetical protein
MEGASIGARIGVMGTHEADLARVGVRLGREPLPHERGRAAVVDRVDEAADVVVDCARRQGRSGARARTAAGCGAPWNCSAPAGQPSLSAMTCAIVWLPLPGREMPMRAPSRSAMAAKRERAPATTAQLSGVAT